MARRGTSFGLILLLVVAAIVLLLVAKSWRSVGPEALRTNDALGASPLDDHEQEEAAGELRSGTLPDLQDARRETDRHGARVQQALDEID